MKERGIIFSGDNPKLILEGRKTQTRRIITKLKFDAFVSKSPNIGTVFRANGCTLTANDFAFCHCPYGVAGDRLWVTEKWRTKKQWDNLSPKQLPIFDYSLPDCDIDYAATPSHQIHGRWRASIHLPKNFSRIMLEILKVRVERLQDISQHDAQAEGIYAWPLGGTPRQTYSKLWDSLHGKGAWDKNPFVWVIEFRLSPDVQSTNAHGEKTKLLVGAAQQEKE